MGRRRLVNAAEAKVLFGLPADEDSLLRHYTLDPIDRLECEVRRRPHNKLGFAVQLCVMRHTGRLLGEEEQPHATVIRYLADQLGVDSQDLDPHELIASDDITSCQIDYRCPFGAGRRKILLQLP